MAYYAYIHCKPDGTPFYVGKGNDARLKRIKRIGNPHHSNIVSKYGESSIAVAQLECSSEDIAFDLERGLIKRLRAMGVEIVNFSDGGEGQSGFRHSDASKEKMRNAKAGKPLPAEQVEKIRLANIGKKMSPESRAKVSAARRGIKFSEEHKEKLRLAKIGKKQTEEHKRKVSESQLGRIWITDGVSFKKIRCTDAIPDGWFVGFMRKKKRNNGR